MKITRETLLPGFALRLKSKILRHYMKAGATSFFTTSMDGEVALCDFAKPDDDPHPEHSKLVSYAHCGPVGD